MAPLQKHPPSESNYQHDTGYISSINAPTAAHVHAIMVNLNNYDNLSSSLNIAALQIITDLINTKPQNLIYY